MPVNRAYINGFATSNAALYQALTALANQADALERTAGVTLGTPGGSQAATAAPAAAQWTITASQGHYVVQITNPAAATAAIQHQIRSALDENFNANSTMATFTLGLGEGTRDIVDPNETRYWQLRSRYQGSNWNSWRSYATTAGVVALNAGALRTS